MNGIVSFEQSQEQMEPNVAEHDHKNQRLEHNLPAQLLPVTVLFDELADHTLEDLHLLAQPCPPGGDLQAPGDPSIESRGLTRRKGSARVVQRSLEVRQIDDEGLERLATAVELFAAPSGRVPFVLVQLTPRPRGELIQH